MYKMTDYMRCNKVTTGTTFLKNINESISRCYSENKKNYKFSEIIIDDFCMLKYIERELKLPLLINDMLHIERWNNIISARYRCIYCGRVLELKTHLVKKYGFFGCINYIFERENKILSLRENRAIVEDNPNNKYKQLEKRRTPERLKLYHLEIDEWNNERKTFRQLSLGMEIKHDNVISIDRSIGKDSADESGYNPIFT